MTTQKFIVRLVKRFAHEVERPVLVDAHNREHDVPGFIEWGALREGDEVELSWRIATRLETRRVPVSEKPG